MTLNEMSQRGGAVAQFKQADLELIRVVVADDHPLMVRGLASLFEMEPDIRLIGQASDGDEVLKVIAQVRPDIALVNLHMPGKSGLDVAAALGETGVKTQVVLFAAQVSDEEFMQAIEHKVRGILLKSMPPRLVMQCVRIVHQGGEFLEKNLMVRAFDRMRRHSNAQKECLNILTRREFAVVQRAMAGLSNKRIATELTVSEGTIKMHLHRAYEKLNLHGRMALAQWGRKQGLI